MAPVTRSQTKGAAPTAARFVPKNPKTQLQINKDRVARGVGRVGKPWPITRADKRSIGRKRPLNTCYRVTPLQALLHQPLFMQWVLAHDSEEVPCNDRIVGMDRECMACVMKDVIREYWGPQNPTDVQAWPDSEIVDGTTVYKKTEDKLNEAFQDTSAMNRLHRLLNSMEPFDDMNQQSDAHECYQAIINAITAKDAAGDEIKDALYQLNCQTTTKCPDCNTATTKTEPSFGLSLPFPNSDLGSIQNAINHLFTQPQHVTKNCPNCGPDLEHTAHTLISAAPHQLVIHLLLFNFKPSKRKWNRVSDDFVNALTPNTLKAHKIVFDPNQQEQGFWTTKPPRAKKNQKPIAYPRMLNLSKYQVNPNSRLQYTLSSVVHHMGRTTEEGHYVSSVKGPAGCFRINDEDVEAVKPGRFLDNPADFGDLGPVNAYVLSYTRQKERGAGLGFYDGGKWVSDVL